LSVGRIFHLKYRVNLNFRGPTLKLIWGVTGVKSKKPAIE
jgi:hypothetical protein